MADEKDATQTQSETGQVAAPVVEPIVTESAKVDYEAKCRELQAERDRIQQEHDALKGEYEAVRPYINFPANDTNSAGNEDDELPITRKEHRQTISQIERRHLAERAADRFLNDNPDLKPYEKMLVSFLTETKNLQDAAKKTREFLENERKKGEEQATKKAEDQKKAAAAASGLGSAGTTSPKTTKEEVETNESYIEQRKQQSREGKTVVSKT